MSDWMAQLKEIARKKKRNNRKLGGTIRRKQGAELPEVSTNRPMKEKR